MIAFFRDGEHMHMQDAGSTPMPFEQLYKHGLIRGGSLENAVVIRDDAVLTTEPLRYPEEFARHKFPKELFDSRGNEAGTFMRAPETQPLDFVANNASLWMDRQILDAYGYADKPITQCYEICYPNTNPGNLTPETQGIARLRGRGPHLAPITAM